MIQRLKHQEESIATQIYQVFQVSYAVEAEILKAVNFPPLKRQVAHFLTSQTEFYGFWKAKKLAAVMEIEMHEISVHIRSLVVDPDYFRQGIASQLITFAFAHFDTDTFTVETGVDNTPAVNLYKRFGFIETRQWDTDHGTRKVAFIRQS